MCDRRRLLIFVLTACAVGWTQTPIQKTGVREAQAPFRALTPVATVKIGKTADWVVMAGEAVWVASTGPNAVHRVDPLTNKIAVSVALPGEACSGLASGFGSLWVPVCGKKPALLRVDIAKNIISDRLPIAPAGPEGGIATSEDSVWMVTDKNGTLDRIDPKTNSVRQKISLPPGSYNPIFSNRVIWVTGVESNVVTAVDSTTGSILESVAVGPKPRFLTAGAGSVWTLNQGDGSISRVEERSRKLIATIEAGIPGTGGDIDYGTGAVWTSVFDVPLTKIDASTNQVVRQWVGKGGDSLRYGYGSIWITDYKKGLLSRIRIGDIL